MFLNDSQKLNLTKTVQKFPEIKEIANKFNEGNINWGLASGSAYFIYSGDADSLDDVDIWVDEKDKDKVSQVLGMGWETRSSERHQAENIGLGAIDIFINCQKFRGKTLLLTYYWTDAVIAHLRKAVIGGIEYRVISPEDVALLKSANPRGEREAKQVKMLLFCADERYFDQRKKECGFQ